MTEHDIVEIQSERKGSKSKSLNNVDSSKKLEAEILKKEEVIQKNSLKKDSKSKGFSFLALFKI